MADTDAGQRTEPERAAGLPSNRELEEIVEARRLFFEYYRAVPTEAPPSEAAFVETGEDLGLRFGGAPLLVRAWGEGPSVLFLHGLYGRGGQFRRFVESVTARGYRAVVFDAPGNGASPSSAVHTDYVWLTLRGITGIEGPPHAMIAHSMGCMWAVYAAAQGIRPGRIVCISPTAARAILFQKYVEMRSIPPPIAERLERMIEGFEGVPPWDHYSPICLAPSLGLPGLVIHGLADEFIPPENARLLAAAWPGADLLLIEKRDHYDILRDRRAVETAVDFVTRA